MQIIVTYKLVKNFYILTSNEGAICTATSNFIASHILITFRTLHNDVCTQGSVRGVIIATQYKEVFSHCDISLHSVDTWKQTCHISATCLGLDYIFFRRPPWRKDVKLNRCLLFICYINIKRSSSALQILV